MATSLPAPTIRHRLWKVRARYPKINKGVQYLKNGVNYVKNFIGNPPAHTDLAYANATSGPSNLTISHLDPQKVKPLAMQGTESALGSISQYDNFKEKILDRCNEYLKAKKIHQTAKDKRNKTGDINPWGRRAFSASAGAALSGALTYFCGPYIAEYLVSMATSAVTGLAFASFLPLFAVTALLIHWGAKKISNRKISKLDTDRQNKLKELNVRKKAVRDLYDFAVDREALANQLYQWKHSTDGAPIKLSQEIPSLFADDHRNHLIEITDLALPIVVKALETGTDPEHFNLPDVKGAIQCLDKDLPYHSVLAEILKKAKGLDKQEEEAVQDVDTEPQSKPAETKSMSERLEGAEGKELEDLLERIYDSNRPDHWTPPNWDELDQVYEAAKEKLTWLESQPQTEVNLSSQDLIDNILEEIDELKQREGEA